MRKLNEIYHNGKTVQEILDLHNKWLNGEKGGVRANLRYAYLQDADLQGADLQDADLQGADLQGADLQGADLQGADLQYTYLKGADLQGANLDFSVLNLSCKGLNFKIDDKQAKQIAYHLINLMQYSDINTSKLFKEQMYKWLEDSHLVTEHDLPKLEER